MPKNFVSELRGEWSESIDECIGLLATLQSFSFDTRPYVVLALSRVSCIVIGSPGCSPNENLPP
jgi:hypothetical protein